MNIEHFCDMMRARIDRFRAEWKAKQKEESDNYPEELNEAEWNEQFQAFLETL